jgi:hypothetical protein
MHGLANKPFLDELSDHQRWLLRCYPLPQIFAVVSWGCAATSWLATILNRHPNIYCVHAANHFWHVLGGCERLDGVRYLRILGSQGHAHMAAGCVHGVSRHLVPECRRSFGRRFNAAVVVREPIARFQSQLALFEQSEGVQAWNLDYVDDLIARTGVTLGTDDYPSRFLVHAANMLNAILEEHHVGRIYRCEDLTRNADALADFVEEITCGKVSPSRGWLRSAIETKPINPHRHGPIQLNDWHIDVIRKVVQPDAWVHYEKLGYRCPDFAVA